MYLVNYKYVFYAWLLNYEGITLQLANQITAKRNKNPREPSQFSQAASTYFPFSKTVTIQKMLYS
jgi:hypothetical protein